MSSPLPSFFKRHWKVIIGVVAVLAVIGAIQEARKSRSHARNCSMKTL